jgi:hypothetical protein
LRSLNDPSADPDPAISPSVNARTVDDAISKTFAAACLRQVTLSAEDDDGGIGEAQIMVVVTDNSRRARSSGYRQTQYRGVRYSPVGESALTCCLAITMERLNLSHGG